MCKIFWNKRLSILSAILLLGGGGRNAHALTSAILPNVQQIVERALNYARTNEDTNTARFNQRYKYTRTRTLVSHNQAGKLTKFKQTQTEENLSQPGSGPVKGRDLNLNSYPITNIVTRFDFTLVGAENVNGRRAYVIEFVPHKNIPVRQIMDPLINRATGTIWVDEEDYALAKAQFHFNSPVNVAHGVVGLIDAFACKISRSRTPEGYWYVHRLDWQLDGRILTVRRIMDYDEARIHQQPINAR